MATDHKDSGPCDYAGLNAQKKKKRRTEKEKAEAGVVGALRDKNTENIKSRVTRINKDWMALRQVGKVESNCVWKQNENANKNEVCNRM